MTTEKTIEEFLDRIRDKRAQTYTINNAYLVLSALAGGYLGGNLIYYFAADPLKFLIPLLLVVLIALGYVMVRHLVMSLPMFSLDHAALLVEKRHPGLNNSLISSWQLQRHLTNPAIKDAVSFPFIRELLRETCDRIKEISLESVINLREVTRSRNILLGILLSLGMAALLLPDFFARSYNNFIAPPVIAKPAPAVTEETRLPPASASAYRIEDITLKFNYPAYTRLESDVVDQPEVHVFPGTEVRVKAKSNLPIASADLVINAGNMYSTSLENDRELTGTFMVKDEGFYQFRVKTPDGEKIILPPKYPITLKKDQFPKIVLFLANPKPVYFENDKVRFFYEAYDDFGIQKINLMMDVNGKTASKLIKNVKGRENEIQGGYIWSLGEIMFEPGDRVQYYLEIFDNDNVLGPKTGLSEIYAFTIFDSRKELENLIDLQDQLIEKMILLLSKSLVGNETILSKATADPRKLKEYLASNTDLLIDIINLAQTIYNQANPIQSFPTPYLTFFENLIIELNGIRKEQTEMMREITPPPMKPTAVGYRPSPIKPVNEKLLGHMERDILFLVKISNRQKMGQVLGLEQRIKELTNSLREEFERIKDKKAPLNMSKLKQQVQKIQQLLRKMMRQLARQTQGLPDEFLNPNAFEELNLEKLAASLEKIMDLMNQGKIDQAQDLLKKMTEDLNTLSRQLNQAFSQMDDLIDTQIMEQIDDSIQTLLKLEKEQKQLLEKTTKINRALLAAQLQKFENKLQDFFASLKKDVNAIQSILRDMDTFFEEHPDMNKLYDLQDQEARLDQEIQALSQETLDAYLKPGLAKKFNELREARKKLAVLAAEKAALRLKRYNKFKNFLPQFHEKYDLLEEFTNLFDLREFDSLFQRTFPLALRWRDKLRMLSKPNPSLSDRLIADLRNIHGINNDISIKLGSMLHELEKVYNALLSEEHKTRMREMAQEQHQIRQQTGELAEQFAQMNEQNPMINPRFSGKMSKAGKHMETAEKNLKQADVSMSINFENRALRELTETREMLNEIKNAAAQAKKSGSEMMTKLGAGRARDPRRGGEIRIQRERVDLPAEDQYQVPGKFRNEILKAMKQRYPKKYQRFVMEYYKELVK